MLVPFFLYSMPQWLVWRVIGLKVQDHAPQGHWSEGSLHWSEGCLVQRVIGPKGHWSERNKNMMYKAKKNMCGFCYQTDPVFLLYKCLNDLIFLLKIKFVNGRFSLFFQMTTIEYRLQRSTHPHVTGHRCLHISQKKKKKRKETKTTVQHFPAKLM